MGDEAMGNRVRVGQGERIYSRNNIRTQNSWNPNVEVVNVDQRLTSIHGC